MKVKLNIKKEYDIKLVQCECGVRYWEDAKVDGVQDTDGTLIPCREGDYWKPLINLEDGNITNWKKGITASIHYKVCDDGEYIFLDGLMNTIKVYDGYVPSFMSPKANGYGDYVIMDIDENGQIDGFKVENLDFLNED